MGRLLVMNLAAYSTLESYCWLWGGPYSGEDHLPATASRSAARLPVAVLTQIA